VLGIGAGGNHAVRAAAASGAACLALVTTPLDDGARRDLAAYPGGLFGVFGREDELADADHVAQLRDDAPQGEFVIYGGVGHDFLDDYADPYDFSIARDAIDRIAAFFEKHLPPAPA
jgi:dienelactone hydrolase